MANQIVGIWEKDYEQDKSGYTNSNYWHKIIVSFDANGNSEWISTRLFEIRLADGTTKVEEFEREIWTGSLEEVNGKTQVDYVPKKQTNQKAKMNYLIELGNNNKIDFIREDCSKIIFKRKPKG